MEYLYVLNEWERTRWLFWCCGNLLVVAARIFDGGFYYAIIVLEKIDVKALYLSPLQRICYLKSRFMTESVEVEKLHPLQFIWY